MGSGLELFQGCLDFLQVPAREDDVEVFIRRGQLLGDGIADAGIRA
jgi:hypothetical protein